MATTHCCWCQRETADGSDTCSFCQAFPVVSANHTAELVGSASIRDAGIFLLLEDGEIRRAINIHTLNDGTTLFECVGGDCYTPKGVK